MWALLPLLAVPFAVMLVMRYKDAESRQRFTVKEFLALEMIMIVLLAIGFFGAKAAAMHDVEIWSGRITAKNHGSHGCCHSYQDCTGTGKNRSCRTRYRHMHDYYWSLSVSTGDEVSIKRCESSSWSVPAAWTAAVVGEPAVVEHSFTNYLKADPDSVLLQTTEDGKAPAYPRVHDFYRIERAVNLSTKMNAKEWSRQLDEVLSSLGAKKEVNIVVVATRNPEPSYANVIEREWLYGKLNDAIFVLGAPDGEIVEWAEVVTLPTGNSALRVAARDELVGLDLTKPEPSIAQIRQLVEAEWKWAGVEQFAYLGWAAQPPMWMMILLYILAVVLSAIGSQYMIEKDVFEEERRYFR